MGIIEDINKGIEKGRRAYESDMLRVSAEMDSHRREADGAAGEMGTHTGEVDVNAGVTDTGSDNITVSELALLDNVEYMTELLRRGYRGRFSAIYIDPPFFTRSKFNATVTVKNAGVSSRVRHLAFDDRFERSLEYYIENMTERLLLMKELLAGDGLLWVHLDWHSSHYIRVVLDELMGAGNFINEIIWCYKSGGSGKKHFSRKHDTLLVYSVSRNYNIRIPEEKSYNRGFKPYNFKGVREYQDENGWYTLVNMKDVWSIDMVGRTSSERNGYATQKPIELMRRIIEASTQEGDLVGDFFCGSGSFLDAAERMGRRWMGCDVEKLALSLARKRLSSAGADFRYISPEQEQHDEGRVDITVISREPLDGGRELLRCSISDFAPEIDTGYIRMSDRDTVLEAARDNPAGLIDYVIINRCKYIYGDFDNMIVIAEGAVDAEVVDVFGRGYHASIT